MQGQGLTLSFSVSSALSRLGVHLFVSNAPLKEQQKHVVKKTLEPRKTSVAALKKMIQSTGYVLRCAVL
jgi:hypothetical protein